MNISGNTVDETAALSDSRVKEFRRLLGKLSYVANSTRPDLAFANILLVTVQGHTDRASDRATV